ncbi:MAG: hypothetical protein H6615_09210 [Ignavibacteria bacterium]|nr:hypothetical protein [Ignavibacteria bacterium]
MLAKFLNDFGYVGFIRPLIIRLILKDNKFTFTYEVTGFRCNKVEKVYIKTVSGNSSFIDYLIFYQKNEPTLQDEPIYAIEETKTDDKESRNTGVYQRCSKFVFIESYYPNTRKIMLYNLQIEQKENPTVTYIFGTKLLLTLGVEILGKKLDKKNFIPFENIDEIINFKKKMRQAPKGNVPISLSRKKDKIEVSGRLFKSGRLSHDPNIGALSIISAVLRQLGWKKDIVITQHGLEQKHVGKTNKFLQIANKIGIKLEGLEVPKTVMNKNYWKYDKDGEKLGTIFIHLVVEEFTNGFSIFENHAGSEKGYFFPLNGEPIPLAKYKDREKYKAGNKKQIIEIPDLILVDDKQKQVINIEGEKYINKCKGILQIKTFNFIENVYIKPSYPKYKIIRTVVLFGSKETSIVEIEVGFLLNKNGQLILSVKSPKLFKEAIKNLLDFWN